MKTKIFYSTIGFVSALLLFLLGFQIVRELDMVEQLGAKNPEELILDKTYLTNTLRMDSLTLKHMPQKDTLRLDVAEENAVIVSQFATWCKPCVREMETFIALNRQVKHLKFFFVSKEEEAVLEKFMERYPDFKASVYRDINSSLDYPQFPMSYLYIHGKFSYYHGTSSNWNTQQNIDLLNNTAQEIN